MDITITCRGCGDDLNVGRTDRRYCSAACRQRIYRARVKGEAPAPAKRAAVKVGRGTIAAPDYLSSIIHQLWTEADHAVTIANELDVTETTPAQAERMRGELARAQRCLRMLGHLVEGLPAGER